MIFSDYLFVVSILLPYICFVRFMNRGDGNREWLLLFVVALSLAYYAFGPGAHLPIFLAFVLGNMLIVFTVSSPMVLAAAAVVNIVALFVLKGVMPAGAPLATSFVVFQIVGLLVRQIRMPQTDITPTGYGFFVTFFPQLVAGPIIHWRNVRAFLERVRAGTVRSMPIDWALLFIGIGFAKKVLIADRLYGPVSVFQEGLFPFSFIDAALFPLLYGLYIYFDFSAYSDIATGLALMIGLRLPINFYSPYRAVTPNSFWHRWHRTLHKFLKFDLRFLYRRAGLPSGIAFVFLIFVFSGYWHGAALGFMIWALGHFAWFMLYPRELMQTLPPAAAWAVNFAVVMLLWVPFALSGPQMLEWAQALASPALSLASAGEGFSSVYLNRYDLIVLAVALGVALAAPNGFQMVRSKRLWGLKRLAAVVFLVASAKYVIDPASPGVPFAYFQF